jgi:mono/diheme cytochrome c family protein
VRKFLFPMGFLHALAFAALVLPILAATQVLGAGQQSATPNAGDALLDAGRDLFLAKCAGCHGNDATGKPPAPNLLEKIGAMNESRFVGTVLHRYFWVVSRDEAGGESGAREAFVEQAMRRGLGDTSMPQWEKDPAVRKDVANIYNYLKAQAATAPRKPH